MRRLPLSLIAVLFAFPGLAADKGDPVGAALSVSPDASALYDRKSRVMVRDGQVLFGDRVSTAAAGAVGVSFADETRLYIAANSDIDIDEYVYAGGTGGDLAISLGKGLLRIASGRIGGTGIAVTTRNVALGLRGTVVTVSVDGRGTTAYVEQGAVVGTVGGATVEIPAGSAGFFPDAGGAEVTTGFPPAVQATVASMTTALAAVATPALAVPDELSQALDMGAAQEAAKGSTSTDGQFGYK